MYKGAIFDLDGTLLKTIDDITDALNIALETHGFGKYCSQDVKYLVGSGVDLLVKRALSKYSYCQEDFENVKRVYIQEYVKLQKHKTTPYQGIVEMLNCLSQMNIKIGIVSNKPYSDVVNIVKYYFEPNLFTSVYGQKEGYNVKPDPRAVLEMIEEFGLEKSEVLYCGDSDVDIITSHNAHVDGVGVTWGFRTREELLKNDPAYLVDSPDEIVEIINDSRKDI